MSDALSSSHVKKMITGLFKDQAGVERAYQSIVQRGYDTADINLVMSDATRERFSSGGRKGDAELASKVAEGGEPGGPVSGTIGTMLPVLAVLGVFFVLPGLGLVVFGPVAAALAGAGAAGLAGVGLMGVLGDWDIPQERIQQYEAGIHAGGILIGVKPRSDQDALDFEQQWKATGGQLVHS